MSIARYISMAVRARPGPAPAGWSRHTAPKAAVAVRLERAHAQLFGQGEGLLVVRVSRRGIGRVGVGLDDAKLV